MAAHAGTDRNDRSHKRGRDGCRSALQRPVNDGLLLLVGTQQLTIRVDLDR